MPSRHFMIKHWTILWYPLLHLQSFVALYSKPYAETPVSVYCPTYFTPYPSATQILVVIVFLVSCLNVHKHVRESPLNGILQRAQQCTEYFNLVLFEHCICIKSTVHNNEYVTYHTENNRQRCTRRRMCGLSRTSRLKLQLLSCCSSLNASGA